jgi:phage replication-related protein YjqB (UPF0714/DUF867 family)
MFDELLAQPGVEEVCELRSCFGFMAYHGGSLEEMTDVIAGEAAAAAGASFYAVKQPPDLRWHIPSTSIARHHSAALDGFLDHVDTVVTVHGFGRDGMWLTLLLGGRNRLLAEHLAEHLRPALPDYDVVTELERIPPALRGLHHANPVNLPAKTGVQLELPPRVRGRSPVWKDWDGPGHVPHTVSLIEALASAASSWTATTPTGRAEPTG